MPQMRPFSRFCNAETPLVQAKQLFFYRENPTGKNVDIVSFWCIDRGSTRFSSVSGSGCRALLRLAEALFFILSFKAQVKIFIPLFDAPSSHRRQSSPGRGTESLRRKRTARNPSLFLATGTQKHEKGRPASRAAACGGALPSCGGEPGEAMQSAEVSQPLPSRRGDLLFKLSQKATGEVSPFMQGEGNVRPAGRGCVEAGETTPAFLSKK